MTHSRPFRVLFLGSMFVSMAVVMVWAGVIGWRKWPEWRAVREMRGAVEANEPGRFLAAIEAVDQLGVAEAAADEIAPLRHHADPRVRMYAVMARTVLGARGPAEAKELIELFDDTDEDIDVRQSAASCLVLFGEQARDAVLSLTNAMMDIDDLRCVSAQIAFFRLGQDITGPLPRLSFQIGGLKGSPPQPNAARREMADFLVNEASLAKHFNTLLSRVK